MTLLLRKRAKDAAKTNDFSTLTWATLDKTLDHAESLVGKNAQIRYGIATESDTGLPDTKYVLVPVTHEWRSEAELASMYTTETLMCGLHEVVHKDKTPVVSPFPKNAALATVHRTEVENRVEIKDVDVDDDAEYNLKAIPDPGTTAQLTFICAHLNFLQLSADYPQLKEGVRVTGAHAVAMAYRTGILETHAAREFIFVRVVLEKDGGYTVADIDPVYAKRANKVITKNMKVDRSSLRMNSQLIELGLGICIGAGTTHYMMNHTTGGRRLNGHNLKALTLNNLYTLDPAMGEASEEEQTSFYYNVTHPVNKRAVANLVLNNSHVYCWHKCIYLPAPSVIYSDTFMTYRQNLIPSGAHKVYVAAFVLRAICQDSLGVFLPDQDIANKVIDLYEKIFTLGARTHVGSRYYTDEPIAISQGEVDDFLPYAAYYVHHKMATTSIAASPHLSMEHADAANAKWKAIIDATVKESALNAPMEQIKNYLALAGKLGFKVDLADESGIKDALDVNKQMEDRINILFS